MQALQSFIQEGLGNINKGQDKVSSDLMLIKRSLQDLPNTFHSSSPSSLKKTPIKKKKKETVPEGKTCGVNVIDSWDCLIENKKGAIGKEIQIPDFNLDMSLSNESSQGKPQYPSYCSCSRQSNFETCINVHCIVL